jgi:hypothetical protein
VRGVAKPGSQWLSSSYSISNIQNVSAVMGKILWLASYPKSGNTWMRAFLHNLMLDPAGAHDINRLDQLTGGDVEPELYRQLSGHKAQDLSIEEAVALRGPVQKRLAAKGPGTQFVKTHSALIHMYGHDCIDLSLTAGAIYLVRDPRDVVLSFSDHLAEPVDRVIELMGRDNAHTAVSDTTMPDVVGSWSQHVESWTANEHPGLLVVRYEDMLRVPAKTFEKVVKFLGVPAASARIAKAIKRSSFKVLANQEARSGFRERSPHAKRFFREGKADAWKKMLSEDQIRVIESRHRDQMERWGYLPSADRSR